MSIGHVPRFAIPEVGVVRPGIDRVRIVSSAPVGALKKLLPIDNLEKTSHTFGITRYQGPDLRLRSSVVVTCARDGDPLAILAAHESALRHYRVTEAELAFDVDAGTIEEACTKLFALVTQLGKFRHQRGHLRVAHKPEKSPPPGCVRAPTLYFENRRARVKMKCYVRYQKLPKGGFGAPCMRLEWTLTGKPALTRHLGGNQIQHLRTADLNVFLKRNIRLERVNLGKLFRPSGSHMPERAETHDWERRATNLIIRKLAYEEICRLGDWNLALMIAHNPALIRSFCRGLRDHRHRVKRGRPKKHNPQSRQAITDYRINQCFEAVELTPATGMAV
jgi:hypothetical protein